MKTHPIARLATLSLLFLPPLCSIAVIAEPQVDSSIVFMEQAGLLAVEAEHFYQQTDTAVRAWHLTRPGSVPSVQPDGDPPHLQGVSRGAYLEILPDTRRTHDHKLVHGENFSDLPAPMATLHYRVHIGMRGRYYVWARIYSTNTEDNGLHVGIDGEWPSSGSRMQWTAKNRWYWDSKQRTSEVHGGVPHLLYLDIDEPGEHTIMFSMREDGIEFDKWLMTLDKEFQRPVGVGPDPLVKGGLLPPAPVAKDARDGDGTVSIGGDLQTWHKVSLDMAGPWASESGETFNPFTDCRMTVVFRHESGEPIYHVPGYFAADGNAGESSATEGNVWRAHLSPDKTGNWFYTISFARGPLVAVDPSVGEPLLPYNAISGQFKVEPSDKQLPDFRARGRLEYIGGRYLRFAGDKKYFLKAGPDAPETFLAYADFDNTEARKKKVPLKTWSPHLGDWESGDPTWKGEKGKGIIGGVNYLSAKGMNNFSFLTYNAGGDGDNVWPFVERDDKLRYDVSKLDQWAIVLEHAQSKGVHLHFKLQEHELDDNREGAQRKEVVVPESMDGGRLGIERKLYLRELIARFGHNLALNWNLGEENSQSYEEQRDMAAYLHVLDPYHHNLVIHTFPSHQDRIYTELLGSNSMLTGVSLQNHWNRAHQRTLKWVRLSQLAGKSWVVANDEQGPANGGAPPDPGFQGFSGTHTDKGRSYDLHDIRKYTLWGNLMAGGAGVEYYFGYELPENDLLCEDFRSRDRSWDYCRIALEFFADQSVPFWEMINRNDLIGNFADDNSKYCFARSGEVYLVYLPTGGSSSLDLSGVSGEFTVNWFNPRTGGPLVRGSVWSVRGGGSVELGSAPMDSDQDWLVVVRRR